MTRMVVLWPLTIIHNEHRITTAHNNVVDDINWTIFMRMIKVYIKRNYLSEWPGADQLFDTIPWLPCLSGFHEIFVGAFTCTWKTLGYDLVYGFGLCDNMIFVGIIIKIIRVNREGKGEGLDFSEVMTKLFSAKFKL